MTPVRVRQVEEQSQLAGARYSGTVEPGTRVDLAFEVGGYIRLQSFPEVAKVTRSGVQPEVVYLDYSQERLAGYGLGGNADLKNLLGSRNITAPGGVIEAPGKKLSVDPSGELRDEREIGDVLRKTVDAWSKQHGHREKEAHGKPEELLKSNTTFIGGGGPRFWFSVTPEQQQPNYAQLVIEVTDKHQTNEIIAPLQRALSAEVPGARIDVRQLENGKPVGIPVAFRIQGDEERVLRDLAEKAKVILRASPLCDRARDSWGADSFSVKMEVESDRANLAGVTNLDVAQSAAVGFSGNMVGQLREGDPMIPIVSRLRSAERGQLSDVPHAPARAGHLPEVRARSEARVLGREGCG